MRSFLEDREYGPDEDQIREGERLTEEILREFRPIIARSFDKIKQDYVRIIAIDDIESFMSRYCFVIMSCEEKRFVLDQVREVKRNSDVCLFLAFLFFVSSAVQNSVEMSLN